MTKSIPQSPWLAAQIAHEGRKFVTVRFVWVTLVVATVLVALMAFGVAQVSATNEAVAMDRVSLVRTTLQASFPFVIALMLVMVGVARDDIDHGVMGMSVIRVGRRERAWAAQFVVVLGLSAMLGAIVAVIELISVAVCVAPSGSGLQFWCQTPLLYGCAALGWGALAHSVGLLIDSRAVASALVIVVPFGLEPAATLVVGPGPWRDLLPYAAGNALLAPRTAEDAAHLPLPVVFVHDLVLVTVAAAAARWRFLRTEL